MNDSTSTELAAHSAALAGSHEALPCSRPGRRFHAGYVVVIILLCLPLVAAYQITGLFRLSSPAAALRGSVMRTVPGSWKTRFTLNLGWVTTTLARLGLQLAPLPPEARTALRSLHGAEVGVYELQGGDTPKNLAALFPAADKAMKARGWERLVGVVDGREVVAVYIPQKGISPKRMKCCLAVLDDRQLVVVGARGNVDPLLELAAARSDWVRGRMGGIPHAKDAKGEGRGSGRVSG